VVQLVAKKTGNENFPNVNLVSSICQLIVPVKQFLKMSLIFDVNSNLSFVRGFFLQLTVLSGMFIQLKHVKTHLGGVCAIHES
jgi:hypothetical protein